MSIRKFQRKKFPTVIKEHLPEEVRARVQVLGYDGGKLAKSRRECYDRILIDAPCSSERHVLSKEQELKVWTPRRIKQLAIRQWALLSAGFLLLKDNGVLIYSTCALSPEENDGVIEKLIFKYEGQVEVTNMEPFENAEKTKYGLMFLPDSSGYGPMYFAKIKKNID